jgi:peptide chain release factor 1
MNSEIIKKLEDIESKYKDLSDRLMDPEVTKDHKKIIDISQKKSEIEDIVLKYREYKKKKSELKGLDEVDQEDLLELIEEEKSFLNGDLLIIEKDIQFMLVPKDPNDSKNVIMEIRAGAGGDEAAIFVSDLYRMYSRYIESLGWKQEIINISESLAGGLKDISFLIKGKGAYSKLKFESGVHRVQRVPKTESAGRIHTSTVTVAVLPEAEDLSLHIEPQDIKVDVYRSSGAGGQSVNTTDSAVRITHIPTGVVVTCQDERSQIKNRAKAMNFLKAKLIALEEEKQRSEIDSERKLQIGTGDRSEKIRTYNYPQGRVTDHRINLTLHKLSAIMEGDISQITESLSQHFMAEKLKQVE